MLERHNPSCTHRYILYLESGEGVRRKENKNRPQPKSQAEEPSTSTPSEEDSEGKWQTLRYISVAAVDWQRPQNFF